MSEDSDTPYPISYFAYDLMMKSLLVSRLKYVVGNLLVVDDTHADSEDHVQHSEDDRQLHFVRVQEDDLVVSALGGGERIVKFYTK